MRTLAHAPAKAGKRCQRTAGKEENKSNTPASSAVLSSGAETCRAGGVFDPRSLCVQSVSAYRASQPCHAAHLGCKCSDARRAQRR